MSVCWPFLQWLVSPAATTAPPPFDAVFDPPPPPDRGQPPPVTAPDDDVPPGVTVPLAVLPVDEPTAPVPLSGPACTPGAPGSWLLAYAAAWLCSPLDGEATTNAACASARAMNGA